MKFFAKNMFKLIFSIVIILSLSQGISWASYQLVTITMNMNNQLNKKIEVKCHFAGERTIHYLYFGTGKSSQKFTVSKQHLNQEFRACFKGDYRCEQCMVTKYVHNPRAVNVVIHPNRDCIIKESKF